MADKIWEKYSADELHAEFNMPYSTPKAGEYLAKIAWVFRMLPLAPAKVLDCGIGSGWTTAWLALAGYKVIGIDISEDILKLAKKNIERYQALDNILELKQTSFENAVFHSLDAVVFYASLHHCIKYKEALKRAYDNLKIGGKIFLVEPGWRHGTSADDKKFMLENPGAIELPLPPYKTIPLLREIGFRKVKCYPNYGYIYKCASRGYPLMLSSIAVHLYKYFDGLVSATK